MTNKFRIKEVLYSDNSIEYKIQERHFLFLWLTCSIISNRWIYRTTSNKVTLVYSKYDTSKFVVKDKILAMEIIKWLSLDINNICFYDGAKTLLFAFEYPNKNSDGVTYYVQPTIEKIIELKKEVFPDKHILKTKNIYYNKKDNSFIKY